VEFDPESLRWLREIQARARVSLASPCTMATGSCLGCHQLLRLPMTWCRIQRTTRLWGNSGQVARGVGQPDHSQSPGRGETDEGPEARRLHCVVDRPVCRAPSRRRMAHLLWALGGQHPGHRVAGPANGAPIVPFVAHPLPNGRMRIACGPEVDYAAFTDPESGAHAINQKCLEGCEQSFANGRSIGCGAISAGRPDYSRTGPVSRLLTLRPALGRGSRCRGDHLGFQLRKSRPRIRSSFSTSPTKWCRNSFSNCGEIGAEDT